MRRLVRFVVVVALAACSRGSGAAGSSPDDRRESPVSGAASAAPAAAPCAHAVCGADYIVEASLVGPCSAGTDCSLALTLVATGDYHVNDEYPYKFKADDSPDVAFLGSDSADAHVFSKSAKDWTKQGEKTGTMSVRFRPSAGGARGQKAIAGVFKLSVCSKDTCRLEQPAVKTTVAVW